MSLFGAMLRNDTHNTFGMTVEFGNPSAAVVSAARDVIALRQRSWWKRLRSLPAALSRLKDELAAYDQDIERQRQNERVRELAREEARGMIAMHLSSPPPPKAARRGRKRGL